MKTIMATKLIDSELRLNGTGGSYSLSVPMEVSSGPAAMAKRPVTLIMTDGEAFHLALRILHKLPGLYVTEHIEPLAEIVRMAERIRQNKETTDEHPTHNSP